MNGLIKTAMNRPPVFGPVKIATPHPGPRQPRCGLLGGIAAEVDGKSAPDHRCVEVDPARPTPRQFAPIAIQATDGAIDPLTPDQTAQVRGRIDAAGIFKPIPPAALGNLWSVNTDQPEAPPVRGQAIAIDHPNRSFEGAALLSAQADSRQRQRTEQHQQSGKIEIPPPCRPFRPWPYPSSRHA